MGIYFKKMQSAINVYDKRIECRQEINKTFHYESFITIDWLFDFEFFFSHFFK